MCGGEILERFGLHRNRVGHADQQDLHGSVSHFWNADVHLDLTGWFLFPQDYHFWDDCRAGSVYGRCADPRRGAGKPV